MPDKEKHWLPLQAASLFSGTMNGFTDGVLRKGGLVCLSVVCRVAWHFAAQPPHQAAGSLDPQKLFFLHWNPMKEELTAPCQPIPNGYSCLQVFLKFMPCSLLPFTI